MPEATPNQIFNDGGAKFGDGLVLTITNPGGSGVEYLANKHDFTAPTRLSRQYGPSGSADGGKQVAVKDFQEFTATLQFNSSADPDVALGASFTEDGFDYKVIDAPTSETLGEITMQTIKATRMQN